MLWMSTLELCYGSGRCKNSVSVQLIQKVVCSGWVVLLHWASCHRNLLLISYLLVYSIIQPVACSALLSLVVWGGQLQAGKSQAAVYQILPAYGSFMYKDLNYSKM